MRVGVLDNDFVDDCELVGVWEDVPELEGVGEVVFVVVAVFVGVLLNDGVEDVEIVGVTVGAVPNANPVILRMR